MLVQVNRLKAIRLKVCESVEKDPPEKEVINNNIQSLKPATP
jgi:hypothetical protein